MLAQMTIGTKLTTGFAALMACLLGLSYFSLSAVGNLRDNLDVSANKTARKILLEGTISRDIAQMRAEMRGIIMAAALKNKEDMETARDSFGNLAREMEQTLKELRPMVATGRAMKGIDDVETGLSAWERVFPDIAQLCAAGRLDEAIALRKEKEVPLAKGMAAGASEIRAAQTELLASATKQAMAEADGNRWEVTVCIGISLLIGAIILWVVRLVNRSLRNAAAELGAGAEQVASAASQVASSSQSLAQGASEQAASLEETSASSEEINSMSRKNSENSRGAADLVTQSQQKFVLTNRALEEMVAAMAEINTQSAKIAKIIKVIDEIAFQTNILALNAAVEAARAGEAGMGFAVVADEVRNLAQRCAQAAKDTSSLIEESIAKSNDGKAKVDQAAVAIRTITEESAKIRTLVDEVSVGSDEQARGIEQIGKAIAQMEQVTQKTAANAEESAAAAEELTAQSEALKETVERLTAMVDAQRAAAAHEASAAKRLPGASPRRPKAPTAGLSERSTRGLVKSGGPAPALPAASASGAGDAFPLQDEFNKF
jgi:methyl-accepting chemotaxis protein/methyl-accepting chemotaxis protein-1 (serine sensor receptor)